MNTSRMVLGTAFLTIAGLSLSGCNYVQNKISEKITEEVAERASGGQFEIDSSENEYTITSEDGTVSIGGSDISGITAVVELPEWISGGENSGVMSSEADGKKSVYGSLESSKSVDETYAYFTKYLSDKGFENITKADYAGTKIVSGTKGENADTNMAVTVTDATKDSGKGVQVVVIYSGPVQK